MGQMHLISRLQFKFGSLKSLYFRSEASDTHNFDETHADHKYTVQGGG